MVHTDDAIAPSDIDTGHQPLYEISVSANGATLWVTGADGSCIARFSRHFGIDVHRTTAEQLAGASQCLFCTHGTAGSSEWEQFREAVQMHHGIDVPEDAIRFSGTQKGQPQ
ncbi:hypothetical protein [Burkholderia vietnamiensis]|uniref:hypothetical protein n=1 Tax=Burkholderia vietnamiensis TaxID=60552 RepID=UPI001D14CE40|nr:hypothetical protein [Burkholderia vietnamiensis]UEC05487.1 hypothetical protein LK462_35355 [Burkholderia vietnamiensis]